MSRSKALTRKLPSGKYKVNKANVIDALRKRRNGMAIAAMAGRHPTSKEVHEEFEELTKFQSNRNLKWEE